MPYRDRAAQRAYQKEWCRRRREEWLKEHGPCVDCGSWENLEVDHVDPRLKISHRVWSWKRERREAELAKCVARCSSCHQEKTDRDHDCGYISHGCPYRGYGRGCRCSECRAAEVRRVSDGRRKRKLAARLTGRTSGFGPANAGSTPAPPTKRLCGCGLMMSGCRGSTGL
jgi:hypothetical protein